MFHNYIRTFVKALKKNRISTSISIFGLSIGMMAVLLAAKYLGFSLTVDSNYVNRDRIFHVSEVETHNGNVNYDGSASYRGVTVTSLREIPEVVSFSKFNWGVEEFVSIEKNGKLLKSFNQRNIFYVDSSFTRIFNLELVYGSLEGVFNEPNSIIITKSISEMYFGKVDPVGMSINARTSWGEEHIWTVKCVVENPPSNSTLRFRILVGGPEDSEDLWKIPVDNQYILLQDSKNYKEVAQKISEVINELPVFKNDNRHISIVLDPLKPSFSKFEFFLISIGVLIMVLSWISFSNLSIVQFMQRQREVFIRRSVGASNPQLVKQYLFETGSIVIFAAVISILFLLGVYDYFAELTRNHLLPLSSNKYYINTIFIGVFLIGALLPSAYILWKLLINSEISILGADKFRFNSGIKKRRILTGVQFGIAICMITFTYIMNLQIKYLYELDKGLSLKNKIIISPPRDSRKGKGKRARTIRHELAKISWISYVSSSTTIPGQAYRQEVNFTLFGSNNKVLMYVNAISRQFIPSYQVKILTGENFSQGADPSNGSKVLINAVSMKLLGLNLSNAVGERLVEENGDTYTIIGVVQDYNKTSPKVKIGPMIFMYGPNRGAYLTLGYASPLAQLDEKMAEVKSIWKEVYSDQPFEYFMLSSYYDNQFNHEDLLLRVMRIFAFIAIFLACFGLIGLSLFETSNSKLEVGIRKTFGASSFRIFFHFLKKYLFLFLLIIVISSPGIYYLVSQWLNEYSYRIELKPVYILVPVLGLLLLSLATIGFHITKISRINPIKILREK